MSDRKDGGPAFPVWELNGKGQPEMTGFGMTLRQYAAIILRVPQSGEEWLDEMISEARRLDAAENAAAAMISTSATPWSRGCEDYVATNAYAMADALLSEREGGGV